MERKFAWIGMSLKVQEEFKWREQTRQLFRRTIAKLDNLGNHQGPNVQSEGLVAALQYQHR